MHFNEQMIKECEVKSNNDYCTVIKYEDTYVQIPSIGRNAKTVFVKEICNHGYTRKQIRLDGKRPYIFMKN